MERRKSLYICGNVCGNLCGEKEIFVYLWECELVISFQYILDDDIIYWNIYYIQEYYSAIKKGNPVICYNVDKPGGHYGKCKNLGKM